MSIRIDNGGSGGGGGGTPGGSFNQLQFNDSGVFGGIADSSWDGNSLTLPFSSEFTIYNTAYGGFSTFHSDGYSIQLGVLDNDITPYQLDIRGSIGHQGISITNISNNRIIFGESDQFYPQTLMAAKFAGSVYWKMDIDTFAYDGYLGAYSTLTSDPQTPLFPFQIGDYYDIDTQPDPVDGAEISQGSGGSYSTGDILVYRVYARHYSEPGQDFIYSSGYTEISVVVVDDNTDVIFGWTDGGGAEEYLIFRNFNGDAFGSQTVVGGTSMDDTNLGEWEGASTRPPEPTSFSSSPLIYTTVLGDTYIKKDMNVAGNIFGANITLSGTIKSGALTSGRIPIISTAGLLVDDADLTFATDTLSATKLKSSSLTSGRVPIVSTSGLIIDDADLTFATDTLSATKLKVTSLTSGGIPVISTGGELIYDADITFNGTVLYSKGLSTGAGGLSNWNINTGILEKYNNINTVRNGHGTEVALSDLTAQSAAIAATTIYPVPATGFYKVSWSATITTAATTSSILGGAAGFQLKYTSPTDSVVKTENPTNIISSAGNTTATCISGVDLAYCKTGTNLQYLFGYTSVGVTAMVYELHITVEAL